MVNAGALFCERPSAVVHNDKRMQAAKKTTANQAVTFFKTSAVEVPNKDSLESPPKEAPSPELLLSCIKITAQSIAQVTKKRVMVKKYRNVILILPSD
jgi:hypothetical protein